MLRKQTGQFLYKNEVGCIDRAYPRCVSDLSLCLSTVGLTTFSLLTPQILHELKRMRDR